MPNPILRGFGHLTQFRGRDTRSQFWPYAGVATALYLVVGWAVLIPVTLPIIGGSTPVSEVEFSRAISRFMLISFLMFAGLVALLAAAVVRRLHDSGRSGLWGLLPLPFASFSCVVFQRLFVQFGSGAPDMGLFFSAFVSNVFYMVGLVTLIVFLSLRSSETPNKYGDLP